MLKRRLCLSKFIKTHLSKRKNVYCQICGKRLAYADLDDNRKSNLLEV